MEFMRDFPDDAACLDFLWVNRFSDDGEHADCPNCGRYSIFRKYQMSNRNTSLVKRGIGGTHHAVSAKYLQGYLNEYVWRYNHRKDGKAQFLTLLMRAVATAV